MGTRLAGLLAAAAIGLAVLTPQPASAAAATLGDRALNWAEATAAGHWYSYGGTGPGYDCSGLVYEAYLHQGITLPRTTYGMLASPHLTPIPLSQARRGDLLFFGAGHVEFDTIWWHTSFGAHHSGTTVGWTGWYMLPAAYRVH